ncbi:uncharacterized protein LOC131155695 [Malania oleifera]|uniref:uncharacterized protein LOC131155695 n=1 Tax=Malania oleifera TaxID=397392 RepID=UPI0025ADB68B|nr:uncharacterized protein LOC131155695 [Malania oleifera]
MKARTSKGERHEKREHIKGSKSFKNQKKNNMVRMGGAGLSLEAFANAKSRNDGYSPALIKKRREFYRNAKFVRRYKKTLKQETQHSDLLSVIKPLEEESDERDARKMSKDKNGRKSRSNSLRDLYERKWEEEEKARIEREATMQAKEEERERAIARRKAMREKMFKKTHSGQPQMKYRIEHLLQTLQGSTT